VAVDLRIRDDLLALDVELDQMNDKKLRQEGAKRGIPEAETLPRVTLQEYIIQNERDRLRAEAYVQPQTGGSDNLHSNPGPDAKAEAEPK
jgi:hypothetical protein